MKSTESWWRAEINWATPSGQLLRKFLALLPRDRHFHITERLWTEIFGGQIDVTREIISPAIARRTKGYGDPPPDCKGILRDM